MNFIAGIDGGGTKTRLRCRDVGGAELPGREFGAFNLNAIGAERFAALVTEIMEHLRSMGECEALCIGSAGISNPEVRRLTAEAAARAGIARYELVGDNVIALAGALAGEPGIIAIAGTGSICFGRGTDGETARAGGWGHLLGDEGSGYALGRDALAAVARAADGLGEETALTALLADEGLDSREKIIPYVYGGEKADVARLSAVTEKAAAMGDAAAKRIMEKNAADLAAQVGAVAKRLRLERVRVALLGGLLEHRTRFRDAFLDAMRRAYPAFDCVEPRYDACEGALLLAAKLREGAHI